MNIESAANRPSQLRQDYDREWSRWSAEEDLNRAFAEHRRSRAPFLDRMRGLIAGLPARSVVAELGCGTAIDLALLARELPGPLYTAIDFSLGALVIARRASQRAGAALSGLVADLARCPFADATLDLVFTQGVMEHFPDPLPLFREQFRLLKPGGTLVINAPQRYTGYTLHKRRAIRRGTWKLGWETEFSARGLRKIGRELGLTEIGIMGYGYWPSRLEPLFVLRDLAAKAHRLLRLPEQSPWTLPRNLYGALWEILERRFGHWFMKNLVIVFRKPFI